LYDINGRKIMERKIEVESNLFCEEASLSSGVYLMSIRLSSGKSVVKKIIK